MTGQFQRMIDAAREFFVGGTRGFSPAELKIVEFVVGALPQSEQLIARDQLRALRLVQRPQRGRIAIAYYHAPETLRKLPYPDGEFCLAKVAYRSNGKVRKTALVLYDGRIMTLERNVPVALEDIQSIQQVMLCPSGFQGVTDEIDQEEHGTSS